MVMVWLRKLHAWIGLVLCLFLAVIALSGASLVFEPELRRLFEPAMRGPVPSLAPADLGLVVARAQAELAPGKIRTIVFASPESALHEVSLADGSKALLDAQGAVRERWPHGTFFDWALELHHKLFADELGIQITGWVGFFALLMVISGLILWWPARRMFSPKPWPARPGRAGWMAAHRDLAVMAAPMLAISLSTGTAQALQGIVRPIMHAEVPKPPKAKTTGLVDATAVLTAAQARFPDAALRMIQFPAKPGAPVTVRLRQPGEWHTNGRTMAWLEPADGTLLKTADAQTANTGSRVFSGLWPVHAAKVGGPVWKLLIFLGGLSLAALSLYGGEAYRRRLFKPKKKR